MKYTKEEINQAREQLLKRLKPGDTIYYKVENVSRSGMGRDISFYNVENGEICFLTYSMMVLLGERRAKSNDGLHVTGCGMDMGFHCIYNLGRVLYPDGFECTGNMDTCRANDHSNGDREYKAGKIHRNGGYAFKYHQI